ncbi:MAG: thioredoxin family protein [Prevotella sp.]
MENKKKKGFWASLFTPKACSCSQEKSYTIPSPTVTPVADAKEITVLGPGCSKCKTTLGIVEKVVKDSGRNIKVTKIEDIEEIMRYNILATPAIVIDGKVVMKGKVPTETDIKRLLDI